MNASLPDLANIAYKHDAPDHDDGGHCVDLLGEKDGGRWLSLVDQYQRAFNLLVDDAVADHAASGNGSALTRPVLFAAHHTCEVAIKASLVAKGVKFKDWHELDALWATAAGAWSADADITAEEVEWAAEFLALMKSITPRGMDGRYADTEIAETWCCLNLEGLRSALQMFVAIAITT